MPNELETLRGRIFFWIGLTVLPLFWVWWMDKSNFSTRQIRTGRLWTVIYILAVVMLWFFCPTFRNRLDIIRWSYSFIAFQIGVALWIWLIFRTERSLSSFVVVLVSMDGLAIALPSMQTLPPHPLSVLFILVPALAHLLVEPVRRFRKYLSNRFLHRPS